MKKRKGSSRKFFDYTRRILQYFALTLAIPAIFTHFVSIGWFDPTLARLALQSALPAGGLDTMQIGIILISVVVSLASFFWYISYCKRSATSDFSYLSCGWRFSVDSLAFIRSRYFLFGALIICLTVLWQLAGFVGRHMDTWAQWGYFARWELMGRFASGEAIICLPCVLALYHIHEKQRQVDRGEITRDSDTARRYIADCIDSEEEDICVQCMMHHDLVGNVERLRALMRPNRQVHLLLANPYVENVAQAFGRVRAGHTSSAASAVWDYVRATANMRAISLRTLESDASAPIQLRNHHRQSELLVRLFIFGQKYALVQAYPEDEGSAFSEPLYRFEKGSPQFELIRAWFITRWNHPTNYLVDGTQIRAATPKRSLTRDLLVQIWKHCIPTKMKSPPQGPVSSLHDALNAELRIFAEELNARAA